MPKLFKLLRSQKRRSSFSPYSPDKEKNQGIFRSTTFRKNSSKKATSEPPVIEVAITYALSDDEESCGIILSSDVDIENQCSAEALQAEDANNNIVFKENGTDPVTTKEIANTKTKDSVKSETSENNKTVTFSHLEIMRNELAHMMQIANKDKKIYQLKQDTEEVRIQHAEIVASKDAEIARIENALKEVETALSLAQNKLASEEAEHTNTIEILMQTQYEYHELSNKSWFQPLIRYF